MASNHETTIWRPRTASDPRSTNIGIPEDNANCFEELQTHYPFIVYLGFSFWRKMLYFAASGSTPTESLDGVTSIRLRTALPHLYPNSTYAKFSTREEGDALRKGVVHQVASFFLLGGVGGGTQGTTSSTAPTSALDQLISPLSHPQVSPLELGMTGQLAKFTADFVPRVFLEHRLPLTQAHYTKLYSLRPKPGMMEFGEPNGEEVVGCFLDGLVSTDQVDAVSLLVTNLNLDLSEQWKFQWEGGRATLLHMAARRSPSVAIPRMILNLMNQTYASFTPHHHLVPPPPPPSHFAIDAPNLPNADCRQTPLSSAAGNQHLEKVIFFLESGSRVNAKDRGDNTPLHYVASLPAKINARTKGNRRDASSPPLPDGFRSRRMSIAKVLLEAGADVDIQNNSGSTPLQLAADSGFVECVELLLDYGASVDVRDNFGVDALAGARRSGFEDVATVLLKSGAADRKTCCSIQ